MEPDRARIDELRLRVPGLSRDQAEAVGREIANRLADGLAGRDVTAHLGHVDLRVRAPHDAGPDRLAEVVARTILERFP